VLWQAVDLHVKGQCSLRTKIHCKKGYRLSHPQRTGPPGFIGWMSLTKLSLAGNNF
jgi:hypothetical protein